MNIWPQLRKKITSQAVYQAVMDVLDANMLPAKNMVSCLMDSCNVMRGSKNGVEQKLRALAPQLLDVDGDLSSHPQCNLKILLSL